MGLNPAHRFDQARRAKRQTEQIRQLRIRPRGHAEARTFIVPIDITPGMAIAPVFFAVDPDNTIPEVKILFELGGMLDEGTADISWTYNDAPLAGSDMTVTTDPDDGITFLDPGVKISHRDYFRPSVEAATDASVLSLSLYVVTRQA